MDTNPKSIDVACIQDDIRITGKDDADHLKNLEAVLKRLDEYGYVSSSTIAHLCGNPSHTWVV